MGRRTKLQAVSIVLAAIAGGTGLIASDARVHHVRDEANFLRWAVETGSLTDYALEARQPWAHSHREELLAEGDRACRWIARQPLAPEVDPSGYFDIGALASRYVHSEPRPPLVPDTSNNAWIAVEAWGNLCQDVRDAHFAPTQLGDD